MAVKGKDLEYEAQEPAFLRRLRAQQAGRGDPDRHERPIARPRGSKKAGDDEDEGPTMVDEENNSVTKEEYERLVNGGDASATEGAASVQESVQEGDAKLRAQIDAEAARSKQDVTEAGHAQKKRKAPKVVGTDEDQTVATKEPRVASKKPKKKVQVVALSFGDDG